MLTKYDPDIELFSVFGDRNNVINSKSKIKIFYTGEPVKTTFFKDYSDNLLNIVDLSIGFNHINNDKYFRFPLWILYTLGYSYSIINVERYKLLEVINNKDKIFEIITNINNKNYIKSKFAELIATWGGVDNIRQCVYNKLSYIDKIYCPSKFLHNDDSLINNFNNDKIEYLKQFKFNICTENSIEDGYITEKIIHSFYAGCIPIWNGDKNLEGDIINKNAVLYFDKESDNKDLIKYIELLNKDDEVYSKFIKQPRFVVDNATDFIYNKIKKLYEKIEELIDKL